MKLEKLDNQTLRYMFQSDYQIYFSLCWYVGKYTENS